MKIFSYITGSNQMSIGVETGEGLFDLTQAFDIYQHVKRVPQPVSFAFLQVLVEMGYASAQTVEKILGDQWVRSKIEGLRLPDSIQFDIPIARPSKIIAIGRNYADHVKELSHQMPDELCFFSKAPSSLTAHESDIIIPEWLDTRVDFEAELGLIVGKTGRNVPEEDAMMYLAGYTIINDVTARAMQKSDIGKGNPWFRSKSLDTFCPAGPFLVPMDSLDDPHDLEIKLTLNGKVCQQANTAQMMEKIPAIVAEVSRFMTLQPGDIIATGTPAGVGEISHGDEVEISITGLGVLRNRVVKTGS